MNEFKNTEEAIDVLTRPYNVSPGEDAMPVILSWAPGDMTRYAVSLLKMRALNVVNDVAVIEVLLVNCGGKTLIISKPRNEFSSYSAELFLAKHGELYAGWWGGVRPLLAGLGWTAPGDQDTKFTHADGNRMGEALARHGTGRL
jgi:hypothetical protein